MLRIGEKKLSKSLERYKRARDSDTKSITNTMKYIHLADTHFGEEDDEFITKVAENIEQAVPLIEAGFIEASDFNGVKIFKKPKSRVVRVS